MKKIFFSTTVATGLALFAMFFGAGNMVFPLSLGLVAGDSNFYAISGLLITAVFLPLLGVVTIALFEGSYEKFFYRMGRLPGLGAMVLCMALLGPLIVIPRTITLAYSIFDYSLLDANVWLWLFSASSCLIIFVFSMYKGKVIDLFAYVLTPLLLAMLLIIIILGLTKGPESPSVEIVAGTLFLTGLIEGYNTLDLLAGLFFASFILAKVRDRVPEVRKNDHFYLAKTVFKAGLLSSVLLALVYTGLSYVTSFYSQHPVVLLTEKDQLLAAISFIVLGQGAGLFSGALAILACFTTAISLTIIFSEFLAKTILKGRLSYQTCAILTLLTTFSISLLGFSGIAAVVVPLCLILYPILIVLTLFNFLHKRYGIKIIKFPLLLTLFASASMAF